MTTYTEFYMQWHLYKHIVDGNTKTSSPLIVFISTEMNSENFVLRFVPKYSDH